MDDVYKEVYFDKYCAICKNKNLSEREHPCGECLSNPVNLSSHKPLFWEENK